MILLVNCQRECQRECRQDWKGGSTFLLCPRTSFSPEVPQLSPASFVPKLLCPQRLPCSPLPPLSPNVFVPERLCPQTSLSPIFFVPKGSSFPMPPFSPNIFVPEVLCPQRLSTPGLPRLSNLLLSLCAITLPRIYPDCQTCFSACVP